MIEREKHIHTHDPLVSSTQIIVEGENKSFPENLKHDGSFPKKKKRKRRKRRRRTTTRTRIEKKNT